MSKDETIAALAKSPLLFDPGTNWEYGFSTDVLGFVVEAVTGKPLGSFLQERLWAPLGMTDTSFALPAAKRSRYALALAKDPLTGNANPDHPSRHRQDAEMGVGRRWLGVDRCRLPALCRDAAPGRPARRSRHPRSGHGGADDGGSPARSPSTT